jgi:hypothetical protein
MWKGAAAILKPKATVKKITDSIMGAEAVRPAVAMCRAMPSMLVVPVWP